MTRKEQFEKRVIEMADTMDEFYQEVDGYTYWQPDGYLNGCFSAASLRALADELDRRNKRWDAMVAKASK